MYMTFLVEVRTLDNQLLLIMSMEARCLCDG